MRINFQIQDVNGVALDSKKRAGDSAQSISTESSAAVTASLSSPAESASALQAQALQFPQVRNAAVNQLKQAIAGGGYNVDPQQLAQDILSYYNN